ncbi:E3 ubiquitin protein ligase DRIP2 isoform X1 [Ricinus communis]|uniref:E3 ubiquitin protein ligase DRIP2 isoform X1 n=1 Tax=Ricinus communis TaxID=3988 RepID=UPI0007724BEE|nr:E3 ubiquitin protein ligase DRIP2 isoform X1 [Ricinus communis]|eukprot:XP_015575879.1 E3 ubiquitin protein ligase DRIP2 isoform X1 [Ricinus communis]
MANQVVKVKRDTIAACMTCPLCDMLLKDATTISECLHTFCRKCIYKKISDEGVECCPICNIDLGCVPLEKLRPDHNLQDVRAKIFPFKRRKVEAPEVTSSVILPVRRKERSLSSLVVNAPKVSAQTTTTGRRTRPVLRKATALRISNFPIEKRIKKEDDPAEDHLENSSSPETVNKFNQNTKQNSSSAEASLFAPNNEAENGAESWDGKSDLWQPLNCLVEVANRSKSFKSIQVSDAKQEATQGHENEPQVRKTKFKEEKLKVEDEKNNIDTPSDAAGPKRLRRIRRKKAANFGDSGISSQAVLNAASVNHEKRAGPVWFSLVASEDQEGDAPLPQIPANYLRIKDGNLPVSFIQKYLKKKLDLASEAEVEIKCMGQPVVPTLLLYNLIDQWVQTASTSERVTTSIGSSAKDFVMVLVYARRVQEKE